MMHSILLVAAALAVTAPQEAASAPQVEATVLFDDDSAFSGPIAVSEAGGLTIEIDQYSNPATIDFDVVSSLVVEPNDRTATWPLVPEAGQDALTLARRQVVRGRVVDLTQDEVTIVSKRFGRMTIPTDECGDLLPAAVADAGPGVSPLWNPWLTDASGSGDLRVVDDTLRMNGRGAVAARRCMDYGGTLEFKLRWRGKPEFRLHVGGDYRDDPPTGVILQPWDDSLILYTWDGEALVPVKTGIQLQRDSSVVLRLSIDADEVELTSAEFADGTIVPSGATVARPGNGGVVAVEALGRPMTIVSARITSGMPQADGRVRFARPVLLSEVRGFDGSAREFGVEAGTVDFDDSLGIRLAWGKARRALDLTDPSIGRFRVTCRDGEAVEVDSLDFVDGALRVRPRWGDAEVDVPLDDLWHLRRKAERKGSDGQRAELIVEGRTEVGVRLSGLEIGEDGLQPTLRVYGFTNTVRLETETPFTLTRSAPSTFHAARRTYPHVLILWDGQAFPGRVARVADGVMSVETPFNEGETDVPVADVRAVLAESSRAMRQFEALEEEARKKKQSGRDARRVFRTGAAQPQRDPTVIDNARLERALQVPRKQANDPGTHLFIAKNGDLLRGNLDSVDAEGNVTVRGGSGPTVEFPMDRLASWVYVGDDRPEPAPEGEGTWQVSLGASNLIRGRATLRGRAVDAEDGRIVIEHDSLGRLSVAMNDVRQIDHVRRAKRQRFVFDKWKTTPMPEPVIDCADDGQ